MGKSVESKGIQSSFTITSEKSPEGRQFQLVDLSWLRAISNQNLWLGRKKGVCLWENRETGQGMFFEKGNLAAMPADFSPKRRKLTGAVITSSPLAEEQKEALLREIRKISRSLRAEGFFFLIEKNGNTGNEGRVWRREILQKAGLKKSAIIQKGESLIWRGRLPVNRHRFRPVNLLEPKSTDSEGMRHWRENLIRNLVARYQKMGCTEIDISEIRERLEKSSNPPEDVSGARAGYGVEATWPCGCRIHTDLEGVEIKIRTCPDHRERSSSQVVPQEKTVAPPTCFDCGEEMNFNLRLKKWCCPRCGED